MGPKERRERERGEARTRILDAARELFVAEGYEAVTMRRIAERIEYSPTAIYLHFRDKEALLKELCDTDFASLAGQFVRLARVKDPVERLRRIGHAYVEFATDFPNHYRLMFMTPHPAIALEDHELTRGNPEEDAYAFLKATVEEAIAAERFTKAFRDADLAAQTIWAGVHGLISLRIAKEQDPWVEWRPYKKRASTMIDLIVAGLTGGKE